VATTNLADRVAAAVQTAFADIADGIGMAEVGAVIPPAAGVVSGVDPRTDEVFVNQLFLGVTGGAGTPKADSWVTYAHVGNGGLCYLDSIELDEIYQPIHVHSRYLMQDTEGSGRFRGASSIYVEYGPVDCAIEIGYVSDGVYNTPKGVRGGGNGRGAEQYRRLVSGELEDLDPCAQITLLEGEAVVSISCGGGGYGPASERDPDKVLHDVREGWISKERARDVYQVAMTADNKIDVEATRALREKTH
jgi:N-methylhydantoinase B